MNPAYPGSLHLCLDSIDGYDHFQRIERMYQHQKFPVVSILHVNKFFENEIIIHTLHYKAFQ